MKKTLVCCFLAIMVASVAASGHFSATTRDDSSETPAAAAKDSSSGGEKSGEAEKAIRATGQTFSRAYSAGDAKKVAAHFAPQGELVDEDGRIVRGRANIEQEFAALFETRPGWVMEAVIDSIRVVAPGVVMEDGHTIVRNPRVPSDPELRNRYTATHVEKEGQWLIASVRDFSSENDVIPPAQRLKPLEWLVGEWVDEDPESVIVTSCRWTKDRSALEQDFEIRIKGRPARSGTQRIGWDPLTKKIKSWSFDSQGGRSEGLWTWDEERWVIKTTGVSPSGAIGSATNFLVPLDKRSYRWQSVDQLLGGDALPNFDALVVRKAPAPKRSAPKR